MAEDQGKPSPKDGQGEGGTPDVVTTESMNRAITARLKDFEKKLDKQLSDMPTTFASKMEEILAQRLPAKADTQDSKTQVLNPLDHPEVKGMKRQLQDLEEQAKQLKAERDEEHARNKDSSLRTKLQEELTSCGVEPKRIRHALGLLVDAEKRVRWDDNGESIVFRDSDGTELNLSQGIKSWIRSEDGKLFLPPRGTSGTGGRPQGGKAVASGQIDRGNLASALNNILLGEEFNNE